MAYANISRALLAACVAGALAIAHAQMLQVNPAIDMQGYLVASHDAASLREFGEVRIVAPHVEMSSAAYSITASRPLSYKRTPVGDIDAYRVNGTPADCVALGMHHSEGVDVVLSGINRGSNLGNAIWHSGTLAAAEQRYPLSKIAF